METPRIYVASLTDYNAGKLHGKWIDADQSVEAIQAEITEMLAKSPTGNAEEWEIHDTEDLEGLNIKESTSLEDVVEAVEFIEEHGDVGAAILKYHSGSIEHATEAMENFAGEFKNLGDWAENFLDDTGFFGMGEFTRGRGNEDRMQTIRRYFDFAAYGRDADMGGDIYTVDLPGGQIAVFHS